MMMIPDELTTYNLVGADNLNNKRGCVCFYFKMSPPILLVTYPYLKECFLEVFIQNKKGYSIWFHYIDHLICTGSV